MTLADELLLDRLVAPLKPPPLLRHDYGCGPLSPARSTILCRSRLPFSKRGRLWNDDFDPFVAALQKVTEEKRRQRHSRLSSPFRAVARCSSDCMNYVDREFSEDSGLVELGHSVGPGFSGPSMDFKGSAYARWVREQTGGSGLRPEKRSNLRNNQEGLEGQARPEESGVGKKKVQKLKEFLKKYGLFRRGSKGTKIGLVYSD